ncbi:MAG: AMP-binding protein, partial [Burkholderiales bacterium]
MEADTNRDDIAVERRGDGSLLLRSRLTLAPVARSLPHLFDASAARWPQRQFMRQRQEGVQGGWRSIGYVEAARQSRAIAQWLLDQGAVPGEVIVALSGPSIEHALLTLATQRVRMALAPLSTGYSLLSQDHLKLTACVK